MFPTLLLFLQCGFTVLQWEVGHLCSHSLNLGGSTECGGITDRGYFQGEAIKDNTVSSWFSFFLVAYALWALSPDALNLPRWGDHMERLHGVGGGVPEEPQLF